LEHWREADSLSAPYLVRSNPLLTYAQKPRTKKKRADLALDGEQRIDALDFERGPSIRAGLLWSVEHRACKTRASRERAEVKEKSFAARVNVPRRKKCRVAEFLALSSLSASGDLRRLLCCRCKRVLSGFLLHISRAARTRPTVGKAAVLRGRKVWSTLPTVAKTGGRLFCHLAARRIAAEA
jgi:hypothetical protein